jgi:hypothetical protein
MIEQALGTFNDRVLAEWLDDGRSMQLHRELRYTDLSGREWIALDRSIVDGASIPEIFWPVIGSPFVGLYRRPTVIHDVYCENQLRPAQEVHDVFFEMMLQEGVDRFKARMMFKAVDRHGPRW